MKQRVLPGFFLLASLALAHLAASAPADTVKGQAHLARAISADMCARLTQESRKQDLAELTTQEGGALMRTIIIGVMRTRQAELEVLLQQAPSQQYVVSQQVSQAVYQELQRNCPVATALLARGQRPASPAKASLPPPDPE